jgi:hypothetical protein
LPAFGDRWPLCVDLPDTARNDETLACLAQHGAGLCWRTASSPTPLPAGRLIVALADETQPRAQRLLLERLSAVAAPGRTLALFFNAADQAQHARTLAELMGV